MVEGQEGLSFRGDTEALPHMLFATLTVSECSCETLGSMLEPHNQPVVNPNTPQSLGSLPLLFIEDPEVS